MFDFRLGQLPLKDVMTLGAQLAVWLEQQLFLIGLMWVMTLQTLGIFSRLMLEFCLGNLLLEDIVAVSAQRGARARQQVGVVRLMRAVATGAFPIFNRLMLHFGGDWKILVASIANLARLTSHFLRE